MQLHCITNVHVHTHRKRVRTWSCYLVIMPAICTQRTHHTVRLPQYRNTTLRTHTCALRYALRRSVADRSTTFAIPRALARRTGESHRQLQQARTCARVPHIFPVDVEAQTALEPIRVCRAGVCCALNRGGAFFPTQLGAAPLVDHAARQHTDTGQRLSLGCVRNRGCGCVGHKLPRLPDEVVHARVCPELVVC